MEKKKENKYNPKVLEAYYLDFIAGLSNFSCSVVFLYLSSSFYKHLPPKWSQLLLEVPFSFHSAGAELC